MSLITLTTDFGLQDNYVGVMKGVILKLNPGAVIVDLAHNLTAHAVEAAAFSLLTAFPFFEKNTVHAAVVDPGVGSKRSILAVKAMNQVFIAPDNGLLSYIIDMDPSCEIRCIENRDLFLSVSNTFHGRDIMAPAAAHVAAGFPFHEIGGTCTSPARLKSIFPEIIEKIIKGRIIHIDRFGNLITNIRGSDLTQKQWQRPRIRLGEMEIRKFTDSYENIPIGDYAAIISSSGFLEIARYMNRADNMPGIKIGVPVEIYNAADNSRE